MPASIKNVIARYREEPQNMGPYEQEEDWVTHLKNKSKVDALPSDVIMKMVDKDKFKSVMKDTKPGVSVNPYDYVDPNTAPKDQRDSAPFVNQIPAEIDQGFYNQPKVFKDESPLDYWEKVREEDWTEDEDQQSPAVSLTRSPGSGRSASFLKTANSLKDVISKDTHYNRPKKEERSLKVSVSLLSNEEEKKSGLYRFSALSPDGEGRVRGKSGAKTVHLQFLRPKSGGGQLGSLLDYPVLISCNCDSFLYHGAQYYAILGRYIYKGGLVAKTRDRNIAPTPRDQVSSYRFNRKNPGRGVNFRVCKHILAVYKFMEQNTQDLKVDKVSEKFPYIGPVSPIINTKVWRDLFGFDFNLEEVKRAVKSRKPIRHFREKTRKRKFIEWVRDVWLPRTDQEKIKVLETISNHPEEIFLIITRDGYYSLGKTSDYLIKYAFDIMDRVIQSGTPPEEVPEPEEGTPKGTGDVSPEGLPSDEQMQVIEESEEAEDSEGEKEEQLKEEEQSKIEEAENIVEEVLEDNKGESVTYIKGIINRLLRKRKIRPLDKKIREIINNGIKSVKSRW